MNPFKISNKAKNKSLTGCIHVKKQTKTALVIKEFGRESWSTSSPKECRGKGLCKQKSKWKYCILLENAKLIEATLFSMTNLVLVNKKKQSKSNKQTKKKKKKKKKKELYFSTFFKSINQ